MYTSIKKLFATTQKVNRQAWTAEEVAVSNARVMQMSFNMSDSYVNTLNVADFNLISHVIQGDTPFFWTYRTVYQGKKFTVMCFLLMDDLR